jgi:hypothetical protein
LIRTVWLASFGLALLGALVAVKVTSAPLPEVTASVGIDRRATALLGSACFAPDGSPCAADGRR